MTSNLPRKGRPPRSGFRPIIRRSAGGSTRPTSKSRVTGSDLTKEGGSTQIAAKVNANLSKVQLDTREGIEDLMDAHLFLTRSHRVTSEKRYE